VTLADQQRQQAYRDDPSRAGQENPHRPTLSTAPVTQLAGRRVPQPVFPRMPEHPPACADWPVADPGRLAYRFKPAGQFGEPQVAMSALARQRGQPALWVAELARRWMR
jgi:hypothetical protein